MKHTVTEIRFLRDVPTPDDSVSLASPVIKYPNGAEIEIVDGLLFYDSHRGRASVPVVAVHWMLHTPVDAQKADPDAGGSPKSPPRGRQAGQAARKDRLPKP